ncbi:MFS transporter [Amycolatopsis sp. AA4]|uniref:DHA2 family efflux MFS transporter permease subunit n=1 Tax=Actinomycetes TaxID=1760 RepID=UPI0001B57071|nr:MULTISPECIES: DHA2 family efflux MFS transporter permease subunit [Actinomycetes]ATY12781.1 MFS transporter [Amycolatopsis sp. AA4]
MTDPISAGQAAGSRTVLLFASAATFVAFLDVTVVNVAFPDLRASFPDVPVSWLTWVVTSYTVLFAALLCSSGRLADVMGRRKLFSSATAAFTAVSLLCAIAPNVELLAVFRALQGAAASAMIPSALGLVLAESPPEKRAAAVGTWGAAGAIAGLVGPVLGGGLVEAFGWRAVFLINIPIGIVVVYGTLRTVRRDQPVKQALPDPVGTVAITVGVGAFVLGLSEGERWGWGSVATVATVLGGAVVTALALLRSRRHPAPAVELSLWRSHAFAQTNVIAAFFGAAMYAVLLSSPLFLTGIWHYSVFEAALGVTPGAVTSAVAAIAVGRWVSPHGRLLMIVFGSLLVVAVTLWMTFGLGSEPQFLLVWLPCSLLSGLGMGAVLTGLASIAAGSLPPASFAAGSGLLMAARQVGGALGIAAVAAILSVGGNQTLDALLSVFGFCAIVSGVAAVFGILLYLRVRARRPAAAAAEKQQADARPS